MFRSKRGLAVLGLCAVALGVVVLPSVSISSVDSEDMVLLTTIGGVPFEHNGETLIKFEPSSGTVFATVKLGEECAFGESC